MTRIRAALAAATAATLVLATPSAVLADARAVDDSCPASTPPAAFSDVPSSSSHAATIDCVVHWKVAQGTGSGRYTPAGGVNRAQMATFISRLITESKGTLPSNVTDAFDDDNGNTHENAINALAAAGVVGGKGNRRYAPDDVVTRDQMATFLVKAFEYRTKTTLAAGTDAFDDDNGTTHEANINRSAAAGFASGTAARQYAPFGTVRRDQMASFLARVLDKLVEDEHATVPPAPTLLLSPGTFGPVTVGMLPTQVEQRLTAAGMRKTEDDTSEYCRSQTWTSSETGEVSLLYSTDDDELFLVGAGDYFGAGPAASTVRSDRGIRLGSTEEQLRNAYPGVPPTTWDFMHGDPGNAYEIRSSAVSLGLIADETGRVTWIGATTPDVLQMTEFCA